MRFGRWILCGIVAACGYGLAARCLAADAVASPLRILNIGDSLSNGKHLQALQTRFVEVGFADYEFVGPVKKGGVPKSTNRQAYGGMRLGAILKGRELSGEIQPGAMVSVPECRPDIILLMGGINNIIGLKSGDLEPIQKEWSELIDYIVKTAPETRILASDIIGVHPERKWADKQPLIDRFNAWLKEEIAARARRGEKIVYVGQGHRISLEDYRSDGLHLLRSGQMKIGDGWFEALVESGIVTISQ